MKIFHYIHIPQMVKGVGGKWLSSEIGIFKVQSPSIGM